MSVMAGYPLDLVRTHRLSDGRTVTIRPIRPDDADRVRDFLAATSEDSRYRRFHKWVHAPSSNLIHFMTDVDYDRDMSLVCSFGHDGVEKLVGEARYGANRDATSCDFAILIEDEWRKSGIAGLLMEALIRAARGRGFDTMEGVILADNAPMLRFARALGFQVDPVAGDPHTVRATRDLAREVQRRASEPSTA
jgi:acetyltransferase